MRPRVSLVPTASIMAGFVLLATGRVAAASNADPQPGFGVTIAIIAILIAMGIARRKRKQYLRSG